MQPYDTVLINVFFKSFSILFTLLFLLYAVIVKKQVAIMNTTVRTETGGILSAVGTLQIFSAIALLLLAIFFV